MQTFIEGIAVARKYQLQNQEMIKPNEQDKISFGCEDDETCAIVDIHSHPSTQGASEHDMLNAKGKNGVSFGVYIRQPWPESIHILVGLAPMIIGDKIPTVPGHGIKE